MHAIVLSLLIGAAATTAATRPSVKTDSDRFRFRYEVEIPSLTRGQTARLWIPLAHTDDFQTVERKVDAGGLTSTVVEDADFGNQLAVVDAKAEDSGKRFVVEYEVRRKEKGAYAAAAGEATSPLHRRADALVPLSPEFKQMAEAAVKGRKTDLERGRALYDYVLGYMKYDKSGEGWGRGDAVYACDAKTGNCTDFHALFIALARSVGIPARFAIGFTIPTTSDAGTVEGYHCWAEFLADGRWVPVDISEAWKDRSRSDYYFGHHPANRFELTAGRDLRVTPAPASGAINFLVHPLAEIDGRVVKKFTGRYSFERLQDGAAKSH